MNEWLKQIQLITDEIDERIAAHDDEALTLGALASRLGYSEFYMTRKFREITGMSLREYMSARRLAFALKQVRDGDRSLTDIALDHGFSSLEAFSRAFKNAYGVSPGEYRKAPRPVVLRTKVNPFDRYLLGLDDIGMVSSEGGINEYFVTVPAHKFLHIENSESNGYWDFWQKQSVIPGQDCDTICGLLDSIKGKLDDDGSELSGQIMAYMNDPTGRLCDWGFLRTECYGARLPEDYADPVPEQMILSEIPEGEYLVFEHGPFDYETQCCAVEEKMEKAMAAFDYAKSGCRLDSAPGRMMYMFYDPKKGFKYIRPIVKEPKT